METLKSRSIPKITIGNKNLNEEILNDEILKAEILKKAILQRYPSQESLLDAWVSCNYKYDFYSIASNESDVPDDSIDVFINFIRTQEKIDKKNFNENVSSGLQGNHVFNDVGGKIVNILSNIKDELKDFLNSNEIISETEKNLKDYTLYRSGVSQAKKFVNGSDSKPVRSIGGGDANAKRFEAEFNLLEGLINCKAYKEALAVLDCFIENTDRYCLDEVALDNVKTANNKVLLKEWKLYELQLLKLIFQDLKAILNLLQKKTEYPAYVDYGMLIEIMNKPYDKRNNTTDNMRELPESLKAVFPLLNKQNQENLIENIENDTRFQVDAKGKDKQTKMKLEKEMKDKKDSYISNLLKYKLKEEPVK